MSVSSVARQPGCLLPSLWRPFSPIPSDRIHRIIPGRWEEGGGEGNATQNKTQNRKRKRNCSGAKHFSIAVAVRKKATIHFANRKESGAVGWVDSGVGWVAEEEINREKIGN